MDENILKKIILQLIKNNWNYVVSVVFFFTEKKMLLVGKIPYGNEKGARKFSEILALSRKINARPGNEKKKKY